MPSLLLLLAPLVALIAAQSSPPPARPSGPHVKLSLDHFDFGTVKTGTAVSGELKIENEGDAPLAVTRIGVTCECAKLQLSTPSRLNVPIDHDDQGKTDLSLAPGDVATLKLTVDTTKLAPGPFEKRCLILCSDPGKSPLSVPFKVSIEPRQQAPEKPAANAKDVEKDGGVPKPPSPPHGELAAPRGDDDDEVDRRPPPAPLPESGPPPRIESDSYKAEFGEVFRGEKLYRTFKLKNSGPGDLVIQEVRSSCACAVAKFTIGDKTYSTEELKEAKRVGTLKTGEEAIVEVELKTAKAMVPGREVVLSKVLRIFSNDPTRNPLVLTLEAKMTSPFVLEPENFSFGRVKRTSGATLSAILYSDQLKPFVISGARSANPDVLKVTATKIAEDEKRPPTWRIDATVLPGAPLGNFYSHIELTVDHERVKEIQIPVDLMVEPDVSFIGNRPDGSDYLDFDVMSGEEEKTLELRIENDDASHPYVPTNVTVEARPLSDAFRVELVEVQKGMKYVVKVTAPKALSKSKFFQGDVVITSDHPDLPVKKVHFRGWFRTASK